MPGSGGDDAGQDQQAAGDRGRGEVLAEEYDRAQFNTTQQTGAALGVAVLSTLAAARTASLHATGAGTAPALAAGYHLAFAAGAGLAVAAIIAAATVLRRTGSVPRRPRAAGTRRDTPCRVSG